MTGNKIPKTRTQIELNTASFNYFIALKLNTHETNIEMIEKAISQIRGTMDDDYYGMRLKELVPDITEVMVNDAMYNNSTEQYEPKTGAQKREAEAAKHFKLDEAMLLVKNICLNNGMMRKSMLKKIYEGANKEAKCFQFSDLEKEFIAWNSESMVKYVDDTAGIRIPLKEFDVITKLLQALLNISNLYEFLEISQKASSQEISQAKKDKYVEYISKGDRNQRSLGKNLCGYVEMVLSDDEKKKQYDYYIKIQEKVWKQFALRKQYGLESLPLNEYNIFATIIKNTLNLDNDAVDEMLCAGLKAYGLVLVGANNKSDELITCPHCVKTFHKN